MDLPDDKVKRALVYAVLGLFLFGILWAGWVTFLVSGHPKPELLPKFIAGLMLTISGTLALNLGVFLGISSRVHNWSDQPVGYLSKVAAWVYLVGVILALVLWAITGFTEDATKISGILPGIASNGLGVMLVAFGAFLKA